VPQIDPDWPQLPANPPELPDWANLGWVSQMDFGELGLRSGIGFARFEENVQLDVEQIAPSEDVEGEMNDNPFVAPDFEQGPTLFQMTFLSDEENGVPFRFTATCGELGCEYDPTVGEFGGYRISGVLDSLADEEGDVDGRMTVVLMADGSVIPNPDEQNVFKVDPDALDNALTIDDPEAFGIEPPADSDGDGVVDNQDNCTEEPNADQRDTNGDGYGNVCDADLNNDGIINVVDLGRLRAVFFTGDPDADFNGDGVVNVVDLGIMRAGFFGAPGPSGVAQ
ncbi:MAG: thrombospondin type 3 repeat-containing protein, partial [Pseudomonadota bacterium]